MVVATAPAPLRASVDRAGSGSRLSRSALAISAVVVLIGVVLAGWAGCGFDSTWNLVWSGDVLGGHAAAAAPGAFLPTPHPGSIAWGLLIRALSFGAPLRTAWAASIEGVFVVFLAGVVVLGRRTGSWAAGWIAAVTLSALPGVAEAVTGGTVDVLFAAACVWTVVLVARAPRAALMLSSFAALMRPEGWVLVVAVAIWSWARLSVRARISAVTALILLPLLWAGVGQLLFSDPLAALHVTLNNAVTLAGRRGSTPLVHAVVSALGPAMAPLWIAVVLVVLGWRRPGPVGRRAWVVAALLAAGLAAAIAGGSVFTPRYLVAELALALPTSVSIVTNLRSRSQQLGAYAACIGVGVATIVGFHSQATTRDIDMRAQSRVLAGLASTLRVAASRCDSVAVPALSFLPVVELSAGRHRAVVVQSTTDGGASCVLRPRDALAMQGASWGPSTASALLPPPPAGMRLLARTTDWTLDGVSR